MLVNVILGLSVIFLFVTGKLRAAGIPVWLLVINMLFFLLQLILLIINQK